MATTPKTKKAESKIEELIESPEALHNEFDLAGDFFERNAKTISYVGGAILFLALAFGGYKYYTHTQNQEAQKLMFQSVYYFEADSLKKALNGDGNNLGLLEIADSYSGTAAGNLAQFYSGTALLKQGKFDEAIERLDKFSASDLLLQARAYSLIGDAYSEKADFENAVKYYEKAANYKPNKQFTPGYLLKLGLALEKKKEFKKAAEAYGKIADNYAATPQANDARKYKALTEELAGE